MKQDINLSTSMLLDPNFEPLIEILSPYRGVTHVPSELSGPALMVFIELQKCFSKANKVCEGLLPNLIWGFEQCGYNTAHVAAGLTKLRELGFIFYSDAGRQRISDLMFTGDKRQQIYVRYDKKFMDLLVKSTVDGLVFKETP